MKTALRLFIAFVFIPGIFLCACYVCVASLVIAPLYTILSGGNIADNNEVCLGWVFDPVCKILEFAGRP